MLRRSLKKVKLEYESTLEDVSEPQVRHFLRSKSFIHQRLRGAFWAGVSAMAVFYVIGSFGDSSRSWWIYPIVFLVGFLVVYSTHRDTVSKRIRRYVKRELGHRMPSATIYDVSDSQIHCSSLGAETIFALDTLSDVNEDTERLELVFGDAGLCTIPLRVFRDAEHKSAFLNSIRREQNAAPDV